MTSPDLGKVRPAGRRGQRGRHPAWPWPVLGAVLAGLWGSMALACGDLAPRDEVYRPESAEVMFRTLSRYALKVGDRFLLDLPPAPEGTHWVVQVHGEGIVADQDQSPEPPKEAGAMAAKSPKAEKTEPRLDKDTWTGPRSYRMTQPGRGGLSVVAQSDTAGKASQMRFITLEIRPEWIAPMVQLTEKHAGQLIAFTQRDVLLIRLRHPDNQDGVWRVEKGLSALDMGPESLGLRTGQVSDEAGQKLSTLRLDTTHMPGQELVLRFYTKAGKPSDRALIYRLSGRPALKC